MLAVVNDLLGESKLEPAVANLHRQRVDLRPVLREVLRELLLPNLMRPGMTTPRRLWRQPLRGAQAARGGPALA